MAFEAKGEEESFGVVDGWVDRSWTCCEDFGKGRVGSGVGKHGRGGGGGGGGGGGRG